jgi:hypothetical protein
VFIFPVFKQAYYFVVMFFFSFITKEFAFKYLSNQCNKYHIALKKVIDESQYEIFPKNSRAWEAWLSWCNQYQLLMSVANNPVLRENVDMRTCCRESSGCFPLKNIGHQKGCMLLYFRDFSLHGKVLHKFSGDGQYSAKSAYESLFHGTVIVSPYDKIWTIFFIWLVVGERCWMADRLERRGLLHPSCCPLCDQDAENINHLLLTWYSHENFGSSFCARSACMISLP